MKQLFSGNLIHYFHDTRLRLEWMNEMTDDLHIAEIEILIVEASYYDLPNQELRDMQWR